MVYLQKIRSEERAGFTLIEIILAIAVAGLVLAAAASFLVSISNIWVTRKERNFFEDHVDGVTEFLRASFDQSGIEIGLGSDNQSSGDNEDEEAAEETEQADATPTVTVSPDGASQTNTGNNSESSSGSGLLRRSEDPISWAKPAGYPDYEDPLLNLKLSQIPPLFVNPDDAPVAGVDVYLHFEEDEGLSLLWYSILQEESEDIDDLRRTELSPLVTSLRYLYWDERFEQWEEETEPKEGDGDDQHLLPQYLKLTFEHEGIIKERTLAIPVQSRSALLF
ncbi:MAG: prepilin-type N-terminal cleavage/methylation domain-containing protein [Verrucomicrobiota bacterium]